MMRRGFFVVCLLLGVSRSAAAEGDISVDATSCLVKPNKIVQLGSSVFGVLKELKVDRADVVTKGQVIGKLDTSVEEAQMSLDRYKAKLTAPIEAAQADLSWNERELERRQKLANNRWSKINDVDEAATRVIQDKIAIRKAQDELKLAELEAMRSEAQYNLKLIHSPLNGVVTEVKLLPGEYIYESTPILTLAQIDPLSVEVVMPAADYGAMKPGDSAYVHLLQPLDRTVQTRIELIDPLIDPASDTFRARLTLPNPNNAIPAGVRCSVTIPTKPR
jgi:membrane fusion protein (multidrug efflux system)